MTDQIFASAKKIIDQIFMNPIDIKMLEADNMTNFINRLGSKLGCNHLSSEKPDAYKAISDYIIEKKRGKSKNTTMPNQNKLNFEEAKKTINKKMLNETSFEIATPKNIMRYDEDIVVKTIKEIVKKEFSNIIVEQIKGDEGGAFYTMVVKLTLEEDIRNDMERKRFYIMQIMSSFRAKFFGSVSAILPVINMRTGSYEYTKNSNDLRFEAVICLSHTNDRDWVSGVYRNIDDKKKKEFDKTMEKNNMKEASNSHRHAIKAMSLNRAIQQFNNGNLDKKMLETAIKACGRSELEFYVLRSVGVDVDVDMNDIDSTSTAADSSNKSEKAYDPNQKIAEAENDHTMMQENVKNKLYETGEFDFVETPKKDIFDVVAQLNSMGCKAAAQTVSRLIVRWPNRKMNKEQVLKIINGR